MATSSCSRAAESCAVTSNSSAPVGQTWVHRPQPVQSLSEISTLRPMVTASCGQMRWHKSQPPTAMRSTMQRWPVKRGTGVAVVAHDLEKAVEHKVKSRAPA